VGKGIKVRGDWVRGARTKKMRLAGKVTSAGDKKKPGKSKSLRSIIHGKGWEGDEKFGAGLL